VRKIKWSKIFLLTMGILVGTSALAFEYKTVAIENTAKVGTENLVLNGYGMRQVTKFGFKVDVYVGALYLQEKKSNTNEILNSLTAKRLVMTFVRSVDAEALTDGFRSGFYDNCLKDCENRSKQFAEFAKNVKNVRTKNQIVIDFLNDGVVVEVIGANAHKAEIKNANLSVNLLNIFINEKNPPTPEFREGLLGLKKIQ
jgi:hypothetical protein